MAGKSLVITGAALSGRSAPSPARTHWDLAPAAVQICCFYSHRSDVQFCTCWAGGNHDKVVTAHKQSGGSPPGLTGHPATTSESLAEGPRVPAVV